MAENKQAEVDVSAVEGNADMMNRLSRQIGVYGTETMAKLIRLRVLVVGLHGLGVEVSKNLILAGPAAVTLHDDGAAELKDLGANFYLTEADVGTPRAQAVQGKLQELNSTVAVSVHAGELTEEVVGAHDVVVMTDVPDKAALTRWSSFCHGRGIGFIMGNVFGPAGAVFSDFGENFVCKDMTGENPVVRVVTNISNAEEGVVTLLGLDEDGKAHELPDSDHDGWVTLAGVDGMDEAIKGPWRIKYNTKTKAYTKDGERKTKEVFDPTSFRIGDTRELGTYGGGGIMTQHKNPVTKHYRPLQDNWTQPVATGEFMLAFTDGAKFGRAEQLHFAFMGIFEFQTLNGRLPGVADEADADEVLRLATEANERHRKLNEAEEGSALALEELDADVIKTAAKFAAVEFQPMSCFFGGVVAQEIVKFTSKFTPINQWIHLDAFEVLPAERPADAHAGGVGGRYEHLVSLFGEALLDKVQNIHNFMVGCGALGCEMMKNMALNGVCCGPNGLLNVTDNDNIEISNLNRQFLFRENNVGQPKSIAASEAVKGMNAAINVLAREDLVAPHTENIFNDEFWESQDIITNALDNIKARRYVDDQVVFYGKPLLESGTLGTKCNVQVVVPRLTQSYNDGPVDADDGNIPMCTLRNFPSLIEHAIEWARAAFADQFVEPAAEGKKFVADPAAYLAGVRALLATEDKRTVGMDIFKSLETLRGIQAQVQTAREMTFEGCIAKAFEFFHSQFRDRILQLIHNFPEDHTTEAGERFWSGAKRFPEAATFDAENEQHFAFIVSTANLFAVSYGLRPAPEDELLPADHQWRDATYIKGVLAGLTPSTWAPTGESIAATEEEAKEQQESKLESLDTAAEELAALAEELTSLDVSGISFEPADFEKDEDLNFHIDFLAAAANLRASNYRIEIATRHKVKMIAGKIIPAIATTTASVTGLVMVEFFKVMQDKPLEAYKDASCSLGLNMYLFQEPLPASEAKDEYDPVEMAEVVCRPSGFTKWDKTRINSGSLTVQGFLDAFKAETGLNCTLLFHSAAQTDGDRFAEVSGRMLFDAAPWKQELRDLYAGAMDRPLADWIKERYNTGDLVILDEERNYIELQASCADDEGNVFKVPTVVYKFA